MAPVGATIKPLLGRALDGGKGGAPFGDAAGSDMTARWRSALACGAALGCAAATDGVGGVTSAGPGPGGSGERGGGGALEPETDAAAPASPSVGTSPRWPSRV